MDPCAYTIMGELRELLYSDEGRRFGAGDTEPKYRVGGALAVGKRVPLTGVNRWELYSTVKGVGAFNKRIAEKVNAILAAAAPQHIDGESLERMWRKVCGY